MNNIFDWGESDKRLDKIKDNGGTDAFEHNIEDLLLHHCFAYDLSKEIDKEMPLIKAASIGDCNLAKCCHIDAGNAHLLGARYDGLQK